MYPRIVRRMLIRRSQEQPVTNAAAAGGKIMSTMIRRISEDLTDIVAEIQGFGEDIPVVTREIR